MFTLPNSTSAPLGAVVTLNLQNRSVNFKFSFICHDYRIGNLLVPNDNYCKFEDWLMPILDQMLLEQNTEVRVCF